MFNALYELLAELFHWQSMTVWKVSYWLIDVIENWTGYTHHQQIEDSRRKTFTPVYLPPAQRDTLHYD